MAGDRWTGVAVYGAALVLLAAGSAWWFQAKPDTGDSEGVRDRRRAVERLIPNDRTQLDARTIVLSRGDNLEQEAPDAGAGRYRMVLACAGSGQVVVRFGATETPPLTVPCADQPTAVRHEATLNESFVLTVMARTSGRVAFRWQLFPGPA